MTSLTGIKAAVSRSVDKAAGVALAGAILTVALAILLPFWAVSFGLYMVAWWRGWSPTRVRFLLPAAWLLPGLVWLSGVTPAEQWGAAWQYAQAGAYAAAWIPLLPWVVPAGLTAGALMWAGRWNAARNGVYSSPRQAGIWIERQHTHAMRRARAEAKKPALVPMTTRKGDVVLGRAAMRTESGAGALVPLDPRKLVIPLEAIGRHLVVLGETGTGKTETIQRLAASWQEGTWLQHGLDAGDRPLSILVDCKGGRDGASTARQFLGAAIALGVDPARIGWYPRNVRFDLWHLDPRRMIEVLVMMVKASDQAFFADLQDELVALAVLAPCGPPKSSVELIQRLNGEWLLNQYKSDHPAEREIIKQNRQWFSGIEARYKRLFRRIGQTFDSGRSVDDFDALCVTLEGTENAETASAQAQAFVELVTDLAANGGPSKQRRRVLVIVDEFSAISERVNITYLMERCRSLGIAVIPAAQSWVALGPSEDDRLRLVAAAAGGMLAMGTSAPDSVSRWAGRQITVEAMAKRADSEQGEVGPWSDEGTGRAQHTHLVPPDWLRRLGSHPGQGVYIEHGRATWGVVTPVEVTRTALQIPPSGSVRRAIQQRPLKPIGNRIPLQQLEAGLSGPDPEDEPLAPPISDEPGAGQ